MKNTLKITILLFIILDCSVNPKTIVSNGSPIKFSITKKQYNSQTAEVLLELTMTPAKNILMDTCKHAQLEIVTFDGLFYEGEATWQKSFIEQDTVVQSLKFRLPENDTSCFKITFGCLESEISYTSEKYFVKNNDTLEFWHGNPRYHRPFPKPSHIPKERTGHVIPGEFPYLDSLLGVGDTTTKFPTTETMQLSESDVWEYKKKKLEEKPLDDKPQERLYIDGVMWIRKYGEQFFRIEEPITNTEEYNKRRMDSLMALPPDYLFEICVRAGNPESVDSLKVMFDTMPTLLDGKYYHLKATNAQIDRLLDLGFIFTHNGSHINCIHQLLEKKN